MTGREPQISREWSSYMRYRQVLGSAIIFKHHGWYEWEVGHARLFGILLWQYETKKQSRFKYSKIFKKLG